MFFASCLIYWYTAGSVLYKSIIYLLVLCSQKGLIHYSPSLPSPQGKRVNTLMNSWTYFLVLVLDLCRCLFFLCVLEGAAVHKLHSLHGPKKKCPKRSFFGRGEEGQPHHSLVRTTFSSFSRPNHLEMLVLSILFFKVSNPSRAENFRMKYPDIPSNN